MPEPKKYVPPKLRSLSAYKPVSLTLKREVPTKEQIFAEVAKHNAGKADAAWDD